MLPCGAVQPQIAIIGSGFAGLLFGIKLKQAGIESFTIYEKADRIGGTWRDNVYPGAACDVPAHLYSYSFESKADWTKKYAEQPEILGYLEHCAAKYGLLSHLRVGVEIAEARFDEATASWQLRSKTGESFEARIVVSACGQLNRPAYPDIPSLQSFSGPTFHSARWPNDVALSDRRIAVIGTGASAIQFVPRVAEQAKSLTVFQRSAPWIVPKPDRSYGHLEQTLYKWIPAVQSVLRSSLFASLELGFFGLRSGSTIHRVAQSLCERYLHKSVPDEQLRKVLTPNYPAGCKRILISNDYYQTLIKPHVSVVTEPIVSAQPEGLLTQDGVLHSVDVIIYGTGFRASEFLAPMRIIGRDGRELSEVFSGGAAAYLGITVPCFPNFFLLYGPNTNLGHNSILYMLEAQAHYILSAVKMLRDGKAHYLEVKPEPMLLFRQELKRRFHGTVWEANCTSWYKTATGEQTNNWPGLAFSYRLRTRRLHLADYDTGR